MISKPVPQSPIGEPKDSLDESFMDAKVDLLFATSVETFNKGPSLSKDHVGNLPWMEIDKARAGRKQKNIDYEGKMTATSCFCYFCYMLCWPLLMGYLKG